MWASCSKMATSLLYHTDKGGGDLADGELLLIQKEWFGDASV